MKLETFGPIVARALPWPHRAELTTIVVRVAYGVAFDGATTVLPAEVAHQVGPREPALQRAEDALFKEACEIAVIGDEVAQIAEPRSVELFEVGADGTPTSPRKRIFVMAGASLGPLSASTIAPGGDEVRSVADSQRVSPPAVPLLVAYTRGTSRFEARLRPEMPYAVRAGRDGRPSQIRMTLDGIWLDPAARRIVCTFRGASSAGDGDADAIAVRWGAPREPLATLVQPADDEVDVGTSTVSLPTTSLGVAAAKGLPFAAPAPASRMTITSERQPLAPALPFAGGVSPQQPRPTPVPQAMPGAAPLPFMPARISSPPNAEPRFGLGPPATQPALAPPVLAQPALAPPALAQPALAPPPLAPPVPAQPALVPPALVPPALVPPALVPPALAPPRGHSQQGFPVPTGPASSVSPSGTVAPVSSSPVAPAPLVTRPAQASVAAPRSKDERVALHRDAQRRIWAEPERAGEILASLGLDPVRYRMLKRQLSRPPRS